MVRPFVKYHGIGNDFAVFFDAQNEIDLSPATVSRLCARNTGIGADGVIRVHPGAGGADLAMDHRNADGSAATMCGNGLRCVATFARDHGLVSKDEFDVETGAGVLRVRLLKSDIVEANLGAPAFAPSAVPVRWDGPDALHVPIQVDGVDYELACLFVGTAHAVVFVEDVGQFPVAQVGRAIELDPIFPEGTNVDFVKVTSPDALHMRVWERGVGETRACGTGACAAAVTARLLHGTEPLVTVSLPGGDLRVRWDGSDNGSTAAVTMIGPTERVFSGEVEV